VLDSPAQNHQAHQQIDKLLSKSKDVDVKQAIQSFGVPEDSTLSLEQFSSNMKQMYNLNSKTDAILLKQLFHLFDADKNGVIDFQEWQTALGIIHAESSEARIRFIFNLFDLNDDGFISKEEFESIVTSLWTNPLIRQMFDFAIDERKVEGLEVFVSHFFLEADQDKDGLLSFAEWKDAASKYTHKVTDHKLQVLPNQTGGHVDAFRKLDDGKIMKAVSKLEYQFYKTLPEHPYLHPYVPAFFGTQELNNKNWVIMEDMTRQMKHCCVMDVKMGTTSVGEDATPEKAAVMRSKDVDSTTVTLGLRITGMKVWKEDKNDFVQYTKSWGRKVTAETVTSSLREFFFNGKTFRKDVRDAAVTRLTEILQFIDTQPRFRFYSSSLLFVYDGEVNSQPNLVIKMIDSAHVFPIRDGGKDDGYILGMKNLLQFLSQMN